jgi:polysaccharide pyruvyl transferase WcaK-like protein
MSVPELLQQTNLSRSLVLSYGGGGNYGDELLLEVFLNLLKQGGAKQVDIAYQNLVRYPTYHRDFGYRVVDLRSPSAMLGAIFRNKHIVVAGGGLWGLDMNRSIFIMSLMLWCSRWLLGKKVFLLGVGYYNSTTRMGHLAAFLAAKAATHIVARDDETARNFGRFSKRVSQDTDMAWHSRQLDLGAYQQEADALGSRLSVKGKTIFMTLRRFRPEYKNEFTQRVGECIANNPGRQIIVALMEPREVDPEGYEQLTQWAKTYPHVRIIDFAFNPLALLLFFKRHRRQLLFIGPQFHGLVTAHLSRVPFFPLVYDNKSKELLRQLGHKQTVSIYDLTQPQLQAFINQAEGV